MDNYQCKKCKVLIESDGIPSNANCPEGSYHEWHNLGAVGKSNYQCKKCGTLVKVDRTPPTPYCPSGSYHQWTKL
jgi:RNA polymerase subunit RPABC4/transcription elongation factor Spt4